MEIIRPTEGSTGATTRRLHCAPHFRCPQLLILVLAALLTLSPSRAQAFRTGADTPDLKGTARVRWTANEINFQLYNVAPSGLGMGDVQAEIIRGMHTWEAPTCSGVRFNLQGITYAHASPGDGLNTVEWIQSGWEARGFKTGAAGITDVQYAKTANGKWQIVEADMYLNGTNHSWVLEGDGGNGFRDVLSVVTHELGHMLGLMHPCEVLGADGAPDCSKDPSFATTTMYPIYAPSQATLSADDQNGVCFLYPVDGCANLQCPEGSQCSAGVCAPTCGGLICSEGETCDNDVCVATCNGLACDAGAASCEAGTDCDAGASCVGDGCHLRAGEPGDPCSADADCTSDSCSLSGFCAGPCSIDCDGGSCSDEAAVDCDNRSPLGAKCSEANQCIGGECLAGAEEHAVCTRTCGGTHAACPLDWECNEVQDKRVCTPPIPIKVAGGGCSCSINSLLSKTHLISGSYSFFLVALALAFRRAKRLTHSEHLSDQRSAFVNRG